MDFSKDLCMEEYFQNLTRMEFSKGFCVDKYPYDHETFNNSKGIFFADIHFYLECLRLIMSFNYFIEPEGVFTTPTNGSQGFAIGCKYAADGSEITMLFYEIEILDRLREKDLLKFVFFFYRYKDDLCIGLLWDKDQTINVLKIIAEGYPESLVLKFVASPFFFDFVDLRTYIYPTGNLCNGINKNLRIKLLRKKLATYDINRPNSNTTEAIKLSTIYAYIYRSLKRCNNNRDQQKQQIKSKFIAKSRGFDDKIWRKIRSIVNNKVNKKMTLPENL